MKTSESIKNLTKALLVAQTKMGSATKGAKNPFFKSNYADLPTVMEVVKDPLNEAGILVLQPLVHKDGKNFVNTTLIHAETGEWWTSESEVICSKPNDPQAFGAAQTYARRFGLQAMLFIPSEDDDGNHASGRTHTATRMGHTGTLTETPVTAAPTTATKSIVFTPEELAVSTGPTTIAITPIAIRTSSFSKKPRKTPEMVAAVAEITKQSQFE